MTIPNHPSSSQAVLRSPLLKGLTQPQIDILLEACAGKRLHPDEVLFSEGSSGSSVYIVLSGGLVTVLNHGSRKEKSVATIAPGDVIGEIAMLTGGERTATIKATEPSLVLQLTKDAIHKSGLSGIIYLNMAKTLAARLVKMNQKASKTDNFIETFIGNTDDLAGASRSNNFS
jgi:CRP-like cAMP-binding protein